MNRIGLEYTGSRTSQDESFSGRSKIEIDLIESFQLISISSSLLDTPLVPFVKPAALLLPAAAGMFRWVATLFVDLK